MKKALSILLAVALCFGAAVTAMAASGKITGIVGEITDNDYTGITVRPGKVYEIPLTADLFEWDKEGGKSNEPVTESQLSTGKVTLKTTYTVNKSKNIIDTIEIDSKKMSVTDNKKTAYIKVKFVEDYASTEEFDFDFTIYLALKGNRVSDTAIQFEGTFGHKTVEIDDDEDYVDLSEGIVVQPDGYIRSIDCYLGDGLVVRTKMFPDKLYYGSAEVGVTSSDYKVIDAYPEIDTIYTLKSVNLSGGTVIFELDDKYYVYNEDGKYVGTTEDELKYSSKFYLAEKKIDLSGSSKTKDDDDDDDDDDKDDDDDDEVPVAVEEVNREYDVPVIESNTHDNPMTGDRSFVGIAVAAGLAAVSLLAFTARKSRKG